MLLLTGLLLTGTRPAVAQQKNMIKLSIGDCVNCVSSLDYILRKDPTPVFLIKGDYAPDSLDVLEKFSLEAHRRRIIWNTQLYDSLSRQPESELIQFCGDREVSRSGLRRLLFIDDICGTDSSKATPGTGPGK